MSIKPFIDYVNEGLGKSVAITFGRFNPPTVGHEKLINAVAALRTDVYYVFVSHSQDAKKNPLSYESKIRHMRKMFPRHARSIVSTKEVINMLDAAVYAFDQGFQSLSIVVGQDRIKSFESLIHKYNGVKSAHGFYEFAEIKIVSAGERDPDADDVSGMSASKMRKAAQDNDFELFRKGLPKNYKDAHNLFMELRASMGINESERKHVVLPKVSDIRERYARGEIFNEGDEVIKEGLDLVIVKKKPNYVICKDRLNRLSKEWITELQEK